VRERSNPARGVTAGELGFRHPHAAPGRQSRFIAVTKAQTPKAAKPNSNARIASKPNDKHH
jgi:hypothetical protein